MKAFCFDTETTSLIFNHTLPLQKQGSIIQFYGALVDLSSGEIIKETNHFIKPPKGVSDETIKITHITDEFLEDKPYFAAVANDIREAIECGYRPLAHNAAFDVEMVDVEFERLGQKINWKRPICTVESTIHLKGYRLSLTALHELLFGEGFADAHRADTDTQALIRCACELFKRGEL